MASTWLTLPQDDFAGATLAGRDPNRDAGLRAFRQSAWRVAGGGGPGPLRSLDRARHLWPDRLHWAQPLQALPDRGGRPRLCTERFAQAPNIHPPLWGALSVGGRLARRHAAARDHRRHRP